MYPQVFENKTNFKNFYWAQLFIYDGCWVKRGWGNLEYSLASEHSQTSVSFNGGEAMSFDQDQDHYFIKIILTSFQILF